MTTVYLAQYVCPAGHESKHPGRCPKDGQDFQPAQYYCSYCEYATQHSKSGRCPNCEVDLLTLDDSGKFYQWKKEKTA